MFSKYFIQFIVFSFCGWIYECTFCTVKSKHWENRGFLFGPICPIYGCGAVAIILMYDFIQPIQAGEVPLWQLFFIFMIGSAILEYVTSWALEKRFHARWWDYSNMPFNLNGRICLPASLLFGVLGVNILHFLAPILATVFQSANVVLNEFIAFVIAIVFGADLGLSVAAMSNLVDTMKEMENALNENMENGVQAVINIPDLVSEKALEVKNTIVSPKILHNHSVSFREMRHLRNIRVFDSDVLKNAANTLRQAMMGEKKNEEK